MKKIIISTLFCLSALIANEPLQNENILYDKFYKNQSINNPKMKDFTKENPSLFGLKSGQVLKKNNNDEIILLHFEENLLQSVLISKKLDKTFEEKDSLLNETNFTFKVAKINRITEYNEEKDFEAGIKEELNIFYSSNTNILQTTALYFNETEQKEITLTNVCIKEDLHKDCPKCEYIQGANNKISCHTSKIYKIK